MPSAAGAPLRAPAELVAAGGAIGSSCATAGAAASADAGFCREADLSSAPGRAPDPAGASPRGLDHHVARPPAGGSADSSRKPSPSISSSYSSESSQSSDHWCSTTPRRRSSTNDIQNPLLVILVAAVAALHIKAQPRRANASWRVSIGAQQQDCGECTRWVFCGHGKVHEELQRTPQPCRIGVAGRDQDADAACEEHGQAA